MSATFTTQLRVADRPPVQIGAGAGGMTFRVASAELWDTIRVEASPDTSVSEMKQKVMAALMPGTDFREDYVLKLRGWELLDHNATLRDSGVVNGSILLLAHRRRRPVR